MAPTSSCAAATSNLFGCVSSALDGGGREAPATVQRTFSQGYAYGEDDRHAAAHGRGAAPRSQGLLPVCRALDRGFRALDRGPMLASLYLSFTNYDLFSPPQWL